MNVSVVVLCSNKTTGGKKKKKKDIFARVAPNMLPQLKISVFEVYIVQIRMISCSHTGHHLEKGS